MPLKYSFGKVFTNISVSLISFPILFVNTHVYFRKKKYCLTKPSFRIFLTLQIMQHNHSVSTVLKKKATENLLFASTCEIYVLYVMSRKILFGYFK